MVKITTNGKAHHASRSAYAGSPAQGAAAARKILDRGSHHPAISVPLLGMASGRLSRRSSRVCLRRQEAELRSGSPSDRIGAARGPEGSLVFTETLGSGTYGDLLRTIRFEVREATLLYWFDTGAISGSVINSAMGDGELWPKGGGLPLNLTREVLEQKRAALAAQPVAV